MKTVLFISAGAEAVPGIRIAQAMGLRVVACDGNAQAPGFALADAHLVASTYDARATVEAALDYQRTVGHIDAVTSIGCDASFTVASVAKALNLPGISPESARLAGDKLAMKRKFASDGLPIPWFSAVDNESALRDLVAKSSFQLVIKPVDSRGSRGVLLLNPQVDLSWAFELSRSHSPTGRVMVEQYLAGPQVSTESLVINAVAYTPGMADRNYEYLQRYAPHIIENGGQLPCHLSLSMQKSIAELMQKAASSMGIVNGVIKGDVVVTEQGPHIIEVAARMSGGFLCTHEIPLSTGVDFVRQAIRVALGESPSSADLEPKFQKGVAQRWIFPEPGRVVSIDGVQQARALPGVEEVIMRVKPGDLALPPTDSNAAVGVVMATGENREQAIERAEQAVKVLKVTTEP